jgi:hypothetical protein
MLPRHLTNVPDTKKAIAPYNFVELPNDIVEIQADSLPSLSVTCFVQSVLLTPHGKR